MIGRGSSSGGSARGAGGTGLGPITHIVPPASAAPTAATTWFAANFALFNRFVLASPAQVRYITFNIGAASGNIQVGVGSLAATGSAATATFTRIAHSGVIACPSAADIRHDLGSTVSLSPGEYALFFWADNTTVSTTHGAATSIRAGRLCFNVLNVAGVPASTTIDVATRYLAGLTAELNA